MIKRGLLVLVIILVLFLVGAFFVASQVPSPGHPASEIGPGIFVAGNYSFPGNSNVGIGTTNPQANLDVAGSINSLSLCLGGSCITSWPSGVSSQWTNTTGGIYYNAGNVGIGTTAPSARLYVKTTDANTVPFQVEALVGFDPSFCQTVLGSGSCYRKPITINNAANANALTDYQVLVTVDTASLISAGKMRSDCGDIRFTDSDGSTLLNYWLESGCNSTSTKIWVKVPSIPASSTKTIYLYYGNPNAASASNGNNTFRFFDDFEGASLNTLIWHVAPGTIYTVSNSILKITVGAIGLVNPLGFNLSDGHLLEGKIRYDSHSEAAYSGTLEMSSSQFTGGGNANADATILYMVDNPISSIQVRTFIGRGSSATYDVTGGVGVNVFAMSLNTWYVLGDEATPATAAVWKDYTRMFNKTVSWVKNMRFIALGYFDGGGNVNIKDTSYDWIRVRKYTSPDPTTRVWWEEPSQQQKTVFYIQNRTGNVGIGTTAPAQKLHVEGDTYIAGDVGIGTTNPQANLDVSGSLKSGSLESGSLKIGGGSLITKIEVGYIGTGAPGSAGSTGSVTFSSPFSSTPLIFLTVDESGDNYGAAAARVIAKSPTGFSWNSIGDGAFLAADGIFWMAVGR